MVSRTAGDTQRVLGSVMSQETATSAGGFVTGSRIGRYVLEEQVGHGGMAAVYRARDEQLGRVVALKILTPALAADQAFRQRFVRESKAAAAVDDPHIIPLYEAGESDGVLFIAMRYVPGGDVRTLLYREGPLSPDRVAAIVSPVASALDAAHASGLVHRDVKPANMLLDSGPGRPDHLYLSDFGLSKAATGSVGLTSTGLFLGTVDYAAPEQIEGRKVDGRTDQYSLGCAAFEMLVGEPPFRRDHGMAVLAAHVTQAAPQPSDLRPGLPAGLDAVFAKVLAKAPKDRYAACGDFSAALRTAIGLGRYDTGRVVSKPQTDLAPTAYLPAQDDPPPDSSPWAAPSASPRPAPAGPAPAPSAWPAQPPLAGPAPAVPAAAGPAGDDEATEYGSAGFRWADSEFAENARAGHQPAGYEPAAHQPAGHEPADHRPPGYVPGFEPAGYGLAGDRAASADAPAHVVPGFGPPRPAYPDGPAQRPFQPNQPPLQPNGRPFQANGRPFQADQPPFQATQSGIQVGQQLYQPGLGETQSQRRPTARWVLIAAAAVVAIALAVGIPLIFGSKGSPPARTGSNGATSPVARTSPTSHAKASPHQASPQASPHQASPPQASPQPKSPPASPKPSAPATGWTSYQDPGEFSIDLPPGWSVASSSSDEIKFAGPQPGFIALVEWTNAPHTDAAATWRELSDGKAASDSSYHEVFIRPIEYQGYSTAADWEFTDQYPTGADDEYYDRGFVVHPGTLGFAIELYGPADQFQSVYTSLWPKLTATFKPAS